MLLKETTYLMVLFNEIETRNAPEKVIRIVNEQRAKS